MTEESKFCRIPIKIIVKFGEKFPFDAYLKLSDAKMVKIGHQHEDLTSTIIKYNKTKGVQDIWVHSEDYIKFAVMVKKAFAQQLAAAKDSVEKKIELLEETYEMTKASLSVLGVNADTVEMVQDISKNSLTVAKDYPNVFNLIKKFSDKCPEEFKRAVLIGHISSAIVDTFDWRSDSIKEKCSLAAVLCDILLKPEDIAVHNKLTRDGPISPQDKQLWSHHPHQSLISVKNEKWISKEVISIIEQHHEEPNGGGFPTGMNHTRIGQLPSIVIVAMRFVDLLFENDFDPNKKSIFLFHLKERYSQGHFKKAMAGLAKALNETLV